MSFRSRTTRLSSGSTKKRNYAEGLTSSSEEEGGGGTGGRAGKGRKAAAAAAQSEDDVSDSEDDYRLPKKQKGQGRGRSSAAKKGRVQSDTDDASSDEFVDEADEDEEGEEQDEEEEQDSESDEDVSRRRAKGKGKGKAVTKTRKTNGSNSSGPTYGQSEVIQMIRAPKEKAPSNRISEHTLSFMRDMQDPQKNDREWFAARKDVYDYINANWLDFTATCVDAMIDDVDDTIAWMQPKDLVERIYRDVRFSNDKTPYKRHLSWCMGRMGRKGNYAKYYFALSANNKSGLHAGLYEVTKEDLERIRRQITDRTGYGQALRQLVQQPAFAEAFGSAPKSTKAASKRTSLWGSDDELKRAPKGFDPDHPDALWLRLKSYTVSHSFTDAEVLQPNFVEKMLRIARAAQPLVELMNEIVHGAPPDGPAGDE